MPSNTREHNNNWRGGKHISSHGYTKILVGNNIYAYEHRVVMEKKLGRKLQSIEIVHHIDGDKNNNSPENLKIAFGNANHFLNHRKNKNRRKPGERNPLIFCKCYCGKKILKYDTYGRPRKFISGHNTERKSRNSCHCGCGQIVKTIGRKYVPGHWSQRHHNYINNVEIYCKCGCNLSFMKYDKYGRERKYISGHNIKKRT